MNLLGYVRVRHHAAVEQQQQKFTSSSGGNRIQFAQTVYAFFFCFLMSYDAQILKVLRCYRVNPGKIKLSVCDTPAVQVEIFARLQYTRVVHTYQEMWNIIVVSYRRKSMLVDSSEIFYENGEYVGSEAFQEKRKYALPSLRSCNAHGSYPQCMPGNYF